MKIHESVTLDRITDAVKSQMFGLENPGFCLSCGADHDSCEPDACNYKCYECEKSQVFGASEVLLMMDF